jgi:hypothetical protein
MWKAGAHLLVNHEPKGVWNVTLKSHGLTIGKHVPELDFAPFERCSCASHKLEICQSDLQESINLVASVSP